MMNRCAALVTLLLPIASYGSCTDEISKIERIISANPQTDAAKAIKDGHSPYLAVYGFALLVPGLGEDDQSAVLEEGNYAVIPGTSDAYCSADHKLANERAFQYAEEFNRVIKTASGG